MAGILFPQAALEQAIVNAIKVSTPPSGLSGYNGDNLCRRTYNAKPPPLTGNYFVGVWSDGARPNQSGARDYADHLFSVFVTVVVRFTQPFDRWLEHRDELEKRVHAIEALIHGGNPGYTYMRAAETLADFTHSAADTTRRVGWCEALMSEGIDPIQDCGPEWFHAKTPTALECGCAQRIRFGKARRIQNAATMG
jgi:hypothetical protein